MIPGDAPATFVPQRDAAPEGIYGYYERFRERDRIAWGDREWPLGEPGLVLLRFEDVHAGLRDNRLGREVHRLLPDNTSAPQPAPDTFAELHSNWMLFRDPPDHTRLRSTANMAFTPRHVAAMREPIEALTSRLIADMRTGDRQVDLISSFAYPLPVLVIAGILGIPDDDYPKFRDWANVIAATIDLPVSGLEDVVRRADETTAALSEYFRWIIAERREEPREDLISSLIAAETVEGRLNERELVATLILLLVAGHETTVNLIGNGTLALLQHREQWQALVDDPRLARNATEELLRYDSPVQLTVRWAMEDTEVAGTAIRAGTQVSLILGSANRDPRAFDEPDTLDISRDVGRIMSFGMGIHFCLGSPLARLEGEVAFAALARALPDLELVEDTPDWRPGLVLRGLRTLPVSLHG